MILHVATHCNTLQHIGFADAHTHHTKREKEGEREKGGEEEGKKTSETEKDRETLKIEGQGE